MTDLGLVWIFLKLKHCWRSNDSMVLCCQFCDFLPSAEGLARFALCSVTILHSFIQTIDVWTTHLFILSFTFSFLSPQFQCLENKPHENCAHCHGSAKTILAVRNMSSSCKIISINASTQCLPYNAPKIRIRSANTHHTELQCMSAKDMKTLTHRVHPSSSTDQE